MAEKTEPRVELVVTAKGWTWTLYEDGKSTSYRMDRTAYGAHGPQKGDEYDVFPDDLAEAISDSDELEICRALEWRVGDEESDKLTMPPEHDKRGNCWAESTVFGCPECSPNSCDVCHYHDEPRGECGECPVCLECGGDNVE